jgi:hypothetical protein
LGEVVGSNPSLGTIFNDKELMTMFDKATRAKFRFESPQGLLTTEDLWDLPLTANSNRANLDDIAKGLHHELKSVESEVSFVKPVTKSDNLLALKLDIVKAVIQTLMDERDAAAVEAQRRDRRQRIMAMMEQKKDTKLSEASLEELEAMLNEV